MDPLAESFANSPELFPHALDPRNDSVSFVRLSREDYAAASFLDDRILTPQMPRRTLPWVQIAGAVDAANLKERCGFIFHIGHVGSTLLSRLLGRQAAIFALREPAILRTLAETRDAPQFDARLSVCLRLWSRTFEPGQLALVKATSFVSEIAPDLLARAWAPKAIAMTAAPETWLATILGAENSPREAKMLAPSRLARLHRRLGCEVWQLADMSAGEQIAMGWACEASALAGAVRIAGDRVQVLDFDAFLADLAPALDAAFRHFGIDAGADDIRAILEGPEMRRYSKAPEHAYDAALRAAVLNDARAREGAEIRRGLAWLEQAAASFAPIRDALNLS